MKFSQNWNLCQGFAIRIVVIGLLIQTITALQLEGLVTKKPRVSKYTMKPQAPTSPPSSTSTYRVNTTNGNTCILIRTDGLLSIQYRDKLNEDREADVYLPDNPGLKGICDNSDESSVTLSFRGFILSMYFSKTPGGERWYVNTIELSYSSSNPIFEHIDRPNLNVKLSTPPHTFLFPTPIGKSFECMQEKTIVMFSQDESDRSGHLAKLFLRDTRLQGFMYKVGGQWGSPFQCTATGTYRDESAPFYLGTILGIACIATVAGYGVWRYLKVKKFQYGNM
ncbi:CLUMA_CG018695, isoform A [Clunio marinus]|uniref:CLUMA_CG018695, isoform A n=1 Tax=Clunio marinus TaxID=568069 RepID=A0A1J1J1M6_9DIPT|nr:CLUMA_CG018695, isoform A [Clunio marinus]